MKKKMTQRQRVIKWANEKRRTFMSQAAQDLGITQARLRAILNDLQRGEVIRYVKEGQTFELKLKSKKFLKELAA